MKRIGAVLTVVVAFTLVSTATAAQPSEVVSKPVSQSRSAVVSYWTADRMRNARPVQRAKPGQAPGTGAAKTGTALEVPAPYTGLTRTNGKVFFTDGGVNYVCSGTALQSTNGSAVWTAGHCVNDGPGDFFTNWAFVPAYRDGQRPYGTWAARRLQTTTRWQNAGDFSYDLGAATVSTSGSGATLTATVGGRGIVFNSPRDQRYDAFGYPAAGKFNGQRLWHCDSPLYMSDTRSDPQTMGIQCNMTGGSSGGAWLTAAGAVASVNSYGYQSLKNVMFGPYQGTVAQSLFGTAQTG